MNFDIALARSDIKRAKEIIIKKEYGGCPFQNVSFGADAHTIRFNHALIRRPRLPYVIKSTEEYKSSAAQYNDLFMRIGEKALGCGCDFAPMLDWHVDDADDEHEFYPMLHGETLWHFHSFAKANEYLKLSQESFRKYFHTNIELQNVGFNIDYAHCHNLILTGKDELYFNNIDLSMRPAGKLTLLQLSESMKSATELIKPNFYNRELQNEIISRIEKALRIMPANDQALAFLKEDEC